MNRDELAARAAVLRQMASFIESLPELGDAYYGGMQINIFFNTKEELAVAARAIGSFEKVATDSHFWLRKNFGDRPDDQIDFCVARDKVCKRVAKTIVKPARPEVLLPAEPEREETVFEWECPDSILAPEESEAVEAG